MTIASVKLGALLVASLSLCVAESDAWASDRKETAASVTVVQPAAVTVLDNAPLRTLLQTIAIAPAGVVFSSSSTGSTTAPVTGAARSGGGASARAADSGAAGSTGLPDTDGTSVAGLVEFACSLTGTTINGDAVSVSVGDVSGGPGAGSGRVPVVIAQYN